MARILWKGLTVLCCLTVVAGCTSTRLPSTLHAVPQRDIARTIEQNGHEIGRVASIWSDRDGRRVYVMGSRDTETVFLFEKGEEEVRAVTRESSEGLRQGPVELNIQKYPEPNRRFKDQGYQVLYVGGEHRLRVAGADGEPVLEIEEVPSPYRVIVKGREEQLSLHMLARDSGNHVYVAYSLIDGRELRLVRLPEGEGIIDPWSDHVLISQEVLPLTWRKLVVNVDSGYRQPIPYRVNARSELIFLPDDWFAKMFRS